MGSRLEGTMLKQYLEFWQTILHSDSENGTTKAWTKRLRNTLQSFAERKEVGRRIRSRTRWMQYGDIMSTNLFSLVWERPAGGLIT